MPAAVTPDAQDRAERLRIVSLELAIKAAPYLLPTNRDRITGIQLTQEAEHIAKWLKGET